MDIFYWIEENLRPVSCTTENFIYNQLESQSGYSLPIIYQPFDGSKKSHWADRGYLYDFLYSTEGTGKIVLDFGPGDGWPSLIVAPFVKEVVGIDASIRRADTCNGNAKRLGIDNARFLSYAAGQDLPFEDNSFDGIMASSSVEQTPNPKETLWELFRVLKPGGRLRMRYEAMNWYKNGQEKDIWIAGLDGSHTKLIIFNRNIKEEYAVQYGLTIAMEMHEFTELLSRENGSIYFEKITPEFLEGIKSIITYAQVCKTIHPSGRTIVNWMKEIGFKEIIPSHSGAAAAVRLYDQFSEGERPRDLAAVDEIIKPAARKAIQEIAEIDKDPMITAVK